MYSRRNSTITGVLLVAVVLGFLAVRNSNRGKAARADLIVEIQRFEGYAAHGTLLVETIEANHSEVRKRSLVRRSTGRRSVKVLDRDGYRTQMYRLMAQALSDSGEEELALKLEKFRARGGR